jgi:hypothetical protein
MKNTKCLLAVLLACLLLVAGCSDPTYKEFNMKASELWQKLNESLSSSSIELPEFTKPEGAGLGSSEQASVYKDITITITTVDGKDKIKVTSAAKDLVDHTKVCNAIIDVLVPNEDTGLMKVLLLTTGSGKAGNYVFTRGVSVPENEDGFSEFTESTLLFTAVVKPAEE